jgi:signal transduction histidine kinase
MAGVDLLSLTLSEEKHLRALERMRSSGKRMETMINDMLDLTRARFAPGLGLARSRESLDLHQVLAQTIEELRVSHDGREIQLDGLRACPVTGDRERLLQLFSNLLANAVHHGKPDTAVTVRITDASPAAVVEVHNFGVIPSEMQATLFEPFRRTKRSNGKGLGLGLYIARQIAQAHGGDIAVQSDDVVGTVFKVRLPGV